MMERRSRSAKASRRQASSLRKMSPLPKTAKNVRFHQNGDEASKSRPGASNSSSSTRGLRQMSIKICEKVKQSGKVTCNEVADELLHLIHMEQMQEGSSKLCDDKNIRRRLYDALNVLDAVDVVAKDSKDITWKGMPCSHQYQTRRMVAERKARRKQVEEKQEAIREKVIQQVAYRNLVNYNKLRQKSLAVCGDGKVPLPFVIFNAHPSAKIQCNSSRDMADIMIDASAPFALNDENRVLEQLGLNRICLEDLKQLIPQDMLNYCLKHGLLRGILWGKRSATRNMDDSLEPRAKRFRKR